MVILDEMSSRRELLRVARDAVHRDLVPVALLYLVYRYKKYKSPVIFVPLDPSEVPSPPGGRQLLYVRNRNL